MGTEKKPIVPKWLTDLQQRSWEPEILLSGIVLFGMLRVPAMLDQLLRYFKLNIYGDLNDIDNLVAMFKVGIYWLISGLVLHLVCRGVWIGMVGLSYAFPQGIQKDKLKYKEPFKSKVEAISSFEHIVIRLEKLCSVLFSVSFMLFMSLLGGYFFLLILVIVPFMISYAYFDIGFSGTFFNLFQVWVLIMLTIGFLGMVDFLSLGYFRRYTWFVKLFWPLHRIIGYLTLSRFYRPIYYGMVTNFNRWWFFFFLVTFTITSIIGSVNNVSFYRGDTFSRLQLWESKRGAAAFSGFYQNQNHEQPSDKAQIPSDVISEEVLRLFVVASIRKEGEILEHLSFDSLQRTHPDASEADVKLKMIKHYFQVAIDREEMEIDQWFFHYNTTTNQRGYLTFIPLKQITEGTHTIQVKDPENDNYVSIPFYLLK